MYRYIPTSIIAALDSANGIGKNGTLPWKIKEELQFFRRTTLGQTVIMGRKTWDSLPEEGLPGRNIIVVSSGTVNAPRVVSSFEQAMDLGYKDESIDRVFIAGGASIYQQALASRVVDECILSRIHGQYGCDTFFPMDALKAWQPRTIATHPKFIVQSLTSWDRNPGERSYLDLVRRILATDRVGRDTRNAATFSMFAPRLEFNLAEGFPLLTTKKMFWRGVVEELLFFLRGQTDTNRLSQKGIRIWEHDTSRNALDARGLSEYAEGWMGPMYGYSWRHFGQKYRGADANYIGLGHDQLRELLYELKYNPTSRRLMMTTYDPSMVKDSVLAPCHGLITQFYVRDRFLDCHMYQRSADVFLGLPFNIASYALLVQILGHVTGYHPGRLIISLGDSHVYSDHAPMAQTQVAREPLSCPSVEIIRPFLSEPYYYAPDWVQSAIRYIETLEFSDFQLKNYRYHPALSASIV